jgi:hypothetical protein
VSIVVFNLSGVGFVAYRQYNSVDRISAILIVLQLFLLQFQKRFFGYLQERLETV